MTGRLSHGINGALERWLPERRLFLKSDSETRFIRLRPLTQAMALGGTALTVGWTIVASSVLLMDWVGSGSLREQSLREQVAYEARLNALAEERDQRAAEAATAHERFNVALGRISSMQSELLTSEQRRRELETGIDVIQSTLKRTVDERDGARREVAQLSDSLTEQQDKFASRDTSETLDFVSAALAATSAERDKAAREASQSKQEIGVLALEKRLMQERNERIFSQIEEAVTVSMAPLDKMFRSAGLSPDKILSTVRRGYAGQGGPLEPIAFSTKGAPEDADTQRANGVLEKLDQINLYRLAADRAPISMPVKTAFRFTSPFGGRSDPFHRGYRRHTGVDMAGKHGSPILSTADGVVVKAGWASGYGQMITVRHDFGLETLYGHLSRIRVKVGQNVSRGQQIGDMGSTGRSTGTHLHYEVRVGGKPVNPMTYMMAAKNVF